MAKLLIRTGGAEPAEVEGMVDLLTQNGIVCYVTDSGRWHLGVDALWLADDSRWDEARAFIDVFQKDYAENSKAQYQRQCDEGLSPSFFMRLRTQPGAMLITLVALLIVALVSLVPFLWI